MEEVLLVLEKGQLRREEALLADARNIMGRSPGAARSEASPTVLARPTWKSRRRLNAGGGLFKPIAMGPKSPSAGCIISLRL